MLIRNKPRLFLIYVNVIPFLRTSRSFAEHGYVEEGARVGVRLQVIDMSSEVTCLGRRPHQHVLGYCNPTQLVCNGTNPDCRAKCLKHVFNRHCREIANRFVDRPWCCFGRSRSWFAILNTLEMEKVKMKTRPL